MKPDKATAAIYIRRSATDVRDAEDSDNRSLTSQERECHQWAERVGLTVSHVYRERVGTSASHLTNHRRPQMERALDEMGSSYSTLIVWAFDRATRKGIAEAGAILDRVDKVGGRLVSVTDGVDTDDPTARLIIAIRSEMARDEMTKISERCRRGKEEQRRRGEFLGGRIPVGQQRDDNAPYGVRLDPTGVAAVRRGVSLIIEGASLNRASGTLNDEGHRTGTGGMWSPTALGRVLRSPHLLGHRRYNAGVLTDDDGQPIQVTDPILSEAEFHRVSKVLLKRRRFTDKIKPNQTTVGSSRALLGGLLRCAKCDLSMSHTTIRRPKQVAHRYYRCGGCSGPAHRLSAPLAENYVARCALNFLAILDPESLIVEEVGRRWLARFSPEQVGHHVEIKNELEIIEGRLRDLQVSFFENRTMEASVFERIERNLTNEAETLRADLVNTPPPQANLGALFDLIACADDPEADIVGPDSSWMSLDKHIRREILRVLIDEVTVTQGERPTSDVENRLAISFVTESNVVHLADRSTMTFRTPKRRRAREAS